MPSNSLTGENMISGDQISNRLDDLAFLDEDDMSQNDRDLWADELAEYGALKAVVWALGDDWRDAYLISENYWDTYAHEYADETFDLAATGVCAYFDYDTFAEDLLTNYSQVKFGDTTYYYQS